MATIDALNTLIEHAKEAHPHFESPRGMADIAQAQTAVATVAELVEALDLCFRRLEHKAATCKKHNWKVDDQTAFEKAQAALTKARN